MREPTKTQSFNLRDLDPFANLTLKSKKMPTLETQPTKRRIKAFTDNTSHDIESHFGTSKTAKMLGLSVGTIQKLVDQDILQSWKTQGGHRRIASTSIQEYQRKFDITPIQTQASEQRLRVLLVEDDPVTRQMVLDYCNNAALPIECTAMTSGMEALIHITNINPHLLITDLDMPGIDGFELLRLLRQNPQFDQMSVLVLTALTETEILARGELPPDSIRVEKPVKASWFNGFFTGIVLGRTQSTK